MDPNKSLLPESASCPGLGHTDKKNDQYTGLAQSQPLALSSRSVHHRSHQAVQKPPGEPCWPSPWRHACNCPLGFVSASTRRVYVCVCVQQEHPACPGAAPAGSIFSTFLAPPLPSQYGCSRPAWLLTSRLPSGPSPPGSLAASVLHAGAWFPGSRCLGHHT